MRVLLYEHSGRGGLKHYTEGLAAGLCDLGVEVSLLTNTSMQSSSRTCEPYRIIRRLRDPAQKVPRATWALHRVVTGLYNGVARTLESMRGYDLCHLQNFTPLLDWAMVRMLPLPRILTVHDVHCHNNRWFERGRLFTAVLHSVDRVIVHSAHNADVLVKESGVNPERVSIIPHGLAPLVGDQITQAEARTQLGLPAGSRVALMFGAIRRDKGLDVALEAMRLADDWILLVAGVASDLSPYVALAKRLGVESRVCWKIEFIPDHMVGQYFIAADVVLLPYKPSFESQSGVLFQAYRYHVPVVASDVGSLGETVREDASGVVVPSDDPEALAAALNIAVDMGNSVPWTLLEEKYSWARVARLTLHVYNQVVVHGGQLPPPSRG